jgi:hypothetical protein
MIKFIKKSQNRRNQGFCLAIEGSESEPLTNGSRIRETQKHTDPADPDPQHWRLLLGFADLDPINRY